MRFAGYNPPACRPSISGGRLALALAGAFPAMAGHLVMVEAHALEATFPGSVLLGDCLVRNVSETETASVRYWVTLTFSDGSTTPATGEESTELPPGNAVAMSISAVVPADAPKGIGIFTCHADAVVIAGENVGEQELAAGSDGFRVYGLKPRPR